MTEQTQEIKAIVLNIYEKNEKDAIIKILSKDKILFLFAKGFYSLESKNKSNISIGSISNFEYFINYGKDDYYLLKKASLINILNFSDDNLKQYIQKILNILNSIEKANNYFYEAYLYFLNNVNYYEINYLITYLYFYLLVTKGYKLNTQFCSICNSNQNLYCIDINEGGMLCIKHKKNNQATNLSILKAFFYLGSTYEIYKTQTNESINYFLYKLLRIVD